MQTEELEAAIDPSAALPWGPTSCSGTQAGSEGAGGSAQGRRCCAHRGWLIAP